MKREEKIQKFCDVIFPLPLDQNYTYFIPDDITSFDLIGSRVEVDFGRKTNKIGVVVSVYNESPNLSVKQIKPIKSVIDKTPFFDKEQLLTANKMSKIYLSSWGYFLNQFFPINHKFTMKEGILLKKNKTSKEEISCDISIDELFRNKKLKNINIFVACSYQEKFNFYSSLILYAIKNNLQLLMIFPHTTYIHDFYDYLLKQSTKNIFEEVVLYTGDIPLQDRYEMWYLVRNKLVNVIISTKIGVFLPFNNLSFIIVDEPDSLGYLNPEMPMYNSLFVLENRTKNYSCKLIYSSFSPSISYIYNRNLLSNKKSLQINKNIKIDVAKRDLPKVVVKNIYKFRQVLVIFPYKGSQGGYICLLCKKIFSKNVFKKIIKSKNIFICPECASTHYKEYLPTIKKVLEFLKTNIKLAVIEELDTLKIEDFNKRKIDVLVSDLSILNYIYRINFSNLGAIYFALADEFLYRPNYLTYENFYRIIKTFSSLIPENKIVEFYIEISSKDKFLELINEYSDFYKEELKVRKELKYPPFAHMIKLQIIDKDEKELLAFKDKILKRFENEKNLEVFVEKELEKSYKGYSSVFILKLLNKSNIDKIMQEISFLKKEVDCLIYVQHNPLI